MAKKKRRKQAHRTISTDHIETRSLSLVDEYGTTRAELMCFGGDAGVGGTSIFRLNSDDGQPRKTIQVAPEGGVTIEMFSEEQTSKVAIGANQSGVGFRISEVDGTAWISAGVPDRKHEMPPRAEPYITLRNRDGKSVQIDGSGLTTDIPIAPATTEAAADEQR